MMWIGIRWEIINGAEVKRYYSIVNNVLILEKP
jgi:hypothetical protein